MFEYILKDRYKRKIFARILAHLMGDGNVNDRYIRYNNKDKFLLKDFSSSFNILFPQTHFIKGEVNSGTSFLQIQNKPIIQFLYSLVKDYKSHMLRFPKFLSSIDEKRFFISAIFDDEGCVGLRVFKKTNEIKRNLEIASKSRKFLEDIKNILEEDFDIKCNKVIYFKRNLNGKEFITWKLSITGKENLVRFRDEINFNSPTKRHKLDLMINSYITK